MHFEKKGGLSIRTGISVKGWRITARVRKEKKKGKTILRVKYEYLNGYIRGQI